MSKYRLYIDGEKTEHRVDGKVPAKALKELVKLSNLALVEQNGRYGKALVMYSNPAAYVQVMALTEPWGRVDSPDARTTRLLPGERRS